VYACAEDNSEQRAVLKIPAVFPGRTTLAEKIILKEPYRMKRILVVALLCVAGTLVISSQAKEVPNDVQQALIALDKEWGQTGGDTAKLDKIIGDHVLAVGPKGEAQDKKDLVATNASAAAGVTNASYTADEYKFEMLSSDVVAMTHRGTTKGTKDGKEVTESHRSLHVFQKNGGKWQVVANAQLPIE
jgi:ketosteroid isomerase-like protein